MASKEQLEQRINYYTMSDALVDAKMDAHIERYGERGKIPLDELQMTFDFIHNYIERKGDIDVRSYILPHQNEAKYLPSPLRNVLIFVMGSAGTGKSYSSSMRIVTHPTTTMTGAMNKCTDNLIENCERHVMPNSYNPEIMAIDKTPFRQNKIYLSNEDVQDIFDEVKCNEALVKDCDSMVDMNDIFFRNVNAFNQSEVYDRWCDHLNVTFKAIYNLFETCKKRFDNDFEENAVQNRFHPSPNHSYYQPSSMWLPVVKKFAEKKLSKSPVYLYDQMTTHEQHVRHIFNNCDGDNMMRYGKNGRKFPQMCSSYITCNEFVFDEAGLAPEFMYFLCVLNANYVRMLYNTFLWHTRYPVFILNGSTTQSKGVGGFPTTMLHLKNGVSTQCDAVMVVDNLLQRRRLDNPADDATALHKNIQIRRELNYPSNVDTFHVRKFHEIPYRLAEDPGFMPRALRMYQVHKDCTNMNQAIFKHNVAKLKVCDTVFASARLVYIDGEAIERLFPNSEETLVNYPEGTLNCELSNLTEEEALHNIALAFVAAYETLSKSVDSTHLNTWLPEDCTDYEREMYHNLINQHLDGNTVISLDRYMGGKSNGANKNVVLNQPVLAKNGSRKKENTLLPAEQELQKIEIGIQHSGRWALQHPSHMDPNIEPRIAFGIEVRNKILKARQARALDKMRKASEKAKAMDAETNQEFVELQACMVKNGTGDPALDNTPDPEHAIEVSKVLLEPDEAKRQAIKAAAKDKPIREYPYIWVPARYILSAEQHRKLRVNCRPLEYYLKDGEMFDSAVSKNQSTSKEGWSDKKAAAAADESMHWHYSPKYDMVRLMAFCGISATIDKHAARFGVDDNKAVTERLHSLLDEIKQKVADSQCDFQLFMAIRRTRYLTHNSIGCSALRITNTVLKGIQTPMNRILSNPDISEATSDAFKLCSYAQFVELAFRFHLKEMLKRLHEEQRSRTRALHSLSKRQCLVAMAEESRGDRNLVSAGTLAGIDTDTYENLFTLEEYKTIRDQLPRNLLNMYECYYWLRVSADHDMRTMYDIRNSTRRQKKAPLKGRIPLHPNTTDRAPTRAAPPEVPMRVQSQVSTQALTKPRQAPDTSSQVKVRFPDVALQVNESVHVNEAEIRDETGKSTEESPGEADNSVSTDESEGRTMGFMSEVGGVQVRDYPDESLIRPYFDVLHTIIQHMLIDEHKQFERFSNMKHCIYVKNSGPFFALFAHLIKNDTYTISSTLNPGCLTMLGNKDHEAFVSDMEHDLKKKVNFEKVLKQTEEMIRRHIKSGDVINRGAKHTSFRPQKISDCFQNEVRSLMPELQHDSVVTYLIKDSLIATTVPTCNNNTQWEDVFTKCRDRQSKRKYVRKAEKDEVDSAHIMFPIGQLSRQGQPNSGGGTRRLSTLCNLHWIPFGGGIALPNNFDEAKRIHHKTPSTLICKNPVDVLLIYNVKPTNTEAAELLEQVKRCDAARKLVDTDQVYCLLADAFPSNTTTIQPTQGQTYSCPAVLDLGNTDPDMTLLAETRHDSVENYKCARVDMGTKRLLLPDQMTPVGGKMSEERRKELARCNDKEYLRILRQTNQSSVLSTVYRP